MQNGRKSRAIIRSTALKLLKKSGVSETPVRLSRIIKILDIKPTKTPKGIKAFDKISALIELEDKLLIYNPDHPVVRQRFSVAHEIGHLVLGHTRLNSSHDINSKDVLETESNIFASEILIPFDWIKRDIKSGLTVPELAKKYWVSHEAIGWRLVNSDTLLK